MVLFSPLWVPRGPSYDPKCVEIDIFGLISTFEPVELIFFGSFRPSSAYLGLANDF